MLSQGKQSRVVILGSFVSIHMLRINVYPKAAFCQIASPKRQESWRNNERMKKQWRGEKRIKNAINIPTSANPDIQKSINNLTSTNKIASLIKLNTNIIEHASIFGKAIQKCNKLSPKDTQSVIKIMDCLLESCNIPTIIEFNVFFNAMAQSNSPQIISDYFNKMTDKFEIKPTVLTFASILKSFRKQGKVQYAEQYWHRIVNEFKLEPDEYCYSEMISVYSVAYEKDKATQIFNEYLQKIKQKQLKANMPTFGGYLNTLSRCGDIDGMKNAVNLMYEHGFELQEINIYDIMRGYYLAKEYDKGLDIFQQWIDNEKNPNLAIIKIKCQCLAQKIREIDDKKEKQKVYQQLRRTVDEELGIYGLKKNKEISLCEWDGAIWTYGYNDIDKIVVVFENCVRDGFIRYQEYDKTKKRILIHLERFELWQAQFIIKYLFDVNKNKLLNDKEYALWVKLGNDKTETGIIKELSMLNPPIICDETIKELGMVYVDVISYLSED